MAEVIWQDEAVEELRGIISYINAFDPPAAQRIGSRLFALGESLGDFPRRGRPAAAGLRELVTVSPYILRYRVAGDVVLIVSVKHGARRPE
jgi:plasmid stabilization system protein ParE